MGKRQDRVIDRVVETIRLHTTRKVKPAGHVNEVFALDDLLSRAQRVVRIAFSESSKPDGFPSSTPGNGNPGGGKGGGRVMPVGVVNAAGHKVVDLLPTSSTEMAALTVARPDPISEIGKRVNLDLHTIASALDRLERNLNRFDALQSSSAVPDPPMCWVAQVKYGLPWDILWEPFRTTDFAGQLDQPFDEPRRVSHFVYWFVRNHKRLPAKVDMQQYLAKATVKLRGA